MQAGCRREGRIQAANQDVPQHLLLESRPLTKPLKLQPNLFKLGN